MCKLVITLAAAALFFGSAAWEANAQSQGAAGLRAQAQTFTPIVKAACGGPGEHCPRGRHWVCGPVRCWCAPC